MLPPLAIQSRSQTEPQAIASGRIDEARKKGGDASRGRALLTMRAAGRQSQPLMIDRPRLAVKIVDAKLDLAICSQLTWRRGETVRAGLARIELWPSSLYSRRIRDIWRAKGSFGDVPARQPTCPTCARDATRSLLRRAQTTRAASSVEIVIPRLGYYGGLTQSNGSMHQGHPAQDESTPSGICTDRPGETSVVEEYCAHAAFG